MTTQNTITITSLDGTPLLFTQAEEKLIEGIRDDLTGSNGWSSGDINRVDHEVEITGESKWEREFGSVLKVLSAGRVIVWDENWDDDEAGSRMRTFENGEPKGGKAWVLRELPDDYLTLVAAVREALADSVDDASPLLPAAARALVEAVDPEVKR